MEKIKELFLLFFKMGWIAFGGPAAHIAMMEEEVVTKRKWMSTQEFLDLVGATNLIPGPNSTEMVMHCGYHRAGVPGLFVAGLSFLFPATLLTGLLAFFFVKYGTLPEFEPWVYGIRATVLIIILNALYKLGKKALKTKELYAIGAIVLVANFLGLNEIISIFFGGFLGLLWSAVKNRTKGNIKSLLPFALLQTTAAGVTQISAGKIFLIFLKVGATLFGSGYVLVAYLDGALVQELGWLTKTQLLDAIAIGQFTPGPVLSTATFVGYQLMGIKGAILATIGIFLPSFLFVWLLNPLIPKIRKSKWASAFLDAVNVAAVAIMIAVMFQLSRDVFQDWRTIVLAISAAILVFGFKKTNPILIVVLGIIGGYLLTLIG